MTVYTATTEDLEGICRVCDTLENEKWSKSQIKDSINDIHTTVLAAEDDGILGFCIFTLAADEAMLALIGTAVTSRRKGVAKALFKRMMVMAKESGATALYLECRSRNVPAISMYESLGCERIGLRKNFYIDPVDDGINYRLGL